MKPLSQIEARRMERMWRLEAFNEQRAKEHAEDVVQEVLRKAEEKFRQTTTQPTKQTYDDIH